jgi:hypothetical protein
MAFKLKSGNKPSFKMMGSKPYKKALVGDQHELPDHLKQEILNSPAKQRIVGENTSEIKKDAKGEDFSLALYDTESGIMKGDTIRPGNAPRVGDYIMGGDYELEKKGDKNYEIKSAAKQKEAAKVAGKAALEGAKKLAPKAVENQIKKMLGGGATDSEIRKYVKSTGTGDKYEYNWDNVTQRVESHPLQQKTKTEYEGRARINDDVGVANYKKGFYEKQGKRGTKGTAVTVVEGSDEARLERYGPGRKRHKDKVISKKRAERIMRRKGKSHKQAD